MRLVEVKDRKTIADFHRIARIIYKDDPHWACPLIGDIEKVFSPAENPFFRHGEAARWVLYDDKGRPAGRVAAFIDHDKAHTFDQPTGGMGFFECLDEQEAAFTLFDTCRDWLARRGMEAMDGPVNFGENDRWWGLLVEGFSTPGYGMNYHRPYYRELFEAYGFASYYEQITHELDIRKPFPERFWKIGEWVCSKPGISYRHFEWKRLDAFVDDFKTIYDQAWREHENFSPLDAEALKKNILGAKPILEERFVWLAYHDDVPIGVFAMLPDISPLVKPLRGRLHLLNKLRLMAALKKGRITRAKVMVLGVVPAFQRYGIESGFFLQLRDVLLPMRNYKSIEISWVGDFNPKMLATLEAVKAEFSHRHITYRVLFERGATFRRSRIIPVDGRERTMREGQG